ncbi:uncharacterized protein LOC106669033 [Cimex lectularius]|uniref:Peptidase S1 domain-containing protein n=1 Tax=Cimex lectularius TaxID=79782 RepID=A0A8I6TJ29_CIMLE|nr:uncharacterized protein LOC106669033 [Cimex lectularius]
MKQTLLFVIALITVYFCSMTVNSKALELKEHPSLAMVTNRKLFYCCSGTIVSTWHIVSSCLSFAKGMGTWRQIKDSYEFKVVAGIVSLEQTKQAYAQIRDIKIISIHPGCKTTPYATAYDIGVVLLRSPLIITEYVAPANLVFYTEGATNFSIPKDQSCFMLSWFANNSLRAGKENVNKEQCSTDSLATNVSEMFNCNECFFCTTTSMLFLCSDKLTGSSVFCDDQFVGIYNCNNMCDKVYYFGSIETSMYWITYILTLGDTSRAVPSVFVIVLTASLLVMTS